ncbi:hypothetical protein MMC30_002741 [Trapelia coarctata]|nr:hypothetical protein [Trapelia coarctata]
MDITASVLTVVQSAWTLAVRLKTLIGEIKGQQENVAKLEQKADTLATIIHEVQNACGLQDRRTNYPPNNAAEENIRRTVQNVTSRCRDDLQEFQTELSKLLQEKRTGRFRMGLIVTTWRIQVAGPTFTRIEKSIEGHECSLQLLVNVLHGRSLEATRRVMEEKFTAVLASNERMLSMLQLLAASPERLTQQDTSADLETVPLHRRGTDTTLVGPPTGLENEDQGVLVDDNAQILHKLFVQIFAAWLTQINADKRPSESSDPSIGLPIPKLGESIMARQSSQQSAFELMPPQFDNINNLGRLRRPSSPGLGPTDLPDSLSRMTTRSSNISQASDLPTESLLSDSAASTSASSELSTSNQPASRQLLKAVKKKDIEWMRTLIDSELKPDIEYRDPDDKRKMTPLLLAVKLGDVKTIALLHSKGAKLEAKDELGMTPLILAASLNRVEIMRELLARGADVRAEDKSKRTALHLAIIKSSEAAISYLLNLPAMDPCGQLDARKKVDLNAADKSGSTPLHYCAEFGKLEAAEMLLERAALADTRDVANNNPAYYAIKFRRYYIVELLLARGADFSWPWPVEPTSDEIEKLLNRKGWRRPGSKCGKGKGEGSVEGLGRSRKNSLFSLPSPKFRRKSSTKVKEEVGGDSRTLVRL